MRCKVRLCTIKSCHKFNYTVLALHVHFPRASPPRAWTTASTCKLGACSIVGDVSWPRLGVRVVKNGTGLKTLIRLVLHDACQHTVKFIDQVGLRPVCAAITICEVLYQRLQPMVCCLSFTHVLDSILSLFRKGHDLSLLKFPIFRLPFPLSSIFLIASSLERVSQHADDVRTI